MADYYHCDNCGGKCFYDSDIGSYDIDNRYVLNGYVIDIKALCRSCTKTHKCIVVERVIETGEGEG